MNIFDNRIEMIKSWDNNKVIAEVGVFIGEFAGQIIQHCQPKELRLIDKWDGEACCGEAETGDNMIFIRR